MAGAAPAKLRDDARAEHPAGRIGLCAGLRGGRQSPQYGACFALTIVTFGFYSLYWYYATHDEMKRHSGDGLGGRLALVLAIFIGIASPFLSASEVGKLYERRGMPAPVSGVTGLWMLLLAWFFFVGAIVWFVKVNGALNAYWRSQGAR